MRTGVEEGGIRSLHISDVEVVLGTFWTGTNVVIKAGKGDVSLTQSGDGFVVVPGPLGSNEAKFPVHEDHLAIASFNSSLLSISAVHRCLGC